jgi:VIT1/CCC1 family predicted Fe2+/Mn2+ transporter
MHRYLDPASSLGEILFGLIMTLTFTLGAGIIIEDEGREGARQLLIAVIGCNVAWGIIDGALYLVGQLFDRGRSRKLGMAIRAAADKPAAIALVAEELDPMVSTVLSKSECDSLYGRIADNVKQKPTVATRVTKEDWMGAFTSFWLVVITSAPAAIPFLLFSDARFALRISNAILLALLFLSGYWWARYTLGKPWITGTMFLLGGSLLVLAAIALGG